MRPASRIAIALLVVAVIGGAFIWGRRHAPPPPAAPPPVVQPVTPSVPTPPPPPVKPAVLHPIASAPAPGALPALDNSDDYLQRALDELVGRKSVLSFLIVDGLARRFVATVNNLASDGATADMWPVHRTAGRFDASTSGVGPVISAKNGDRYAAFVHFVDGIDTQRAVALYVRLYPLLQRAYEELGFPGQYFNDRVVEVIDHLLSTPDVAEPIKLKQITVDGSARPSGTGLYVFEDPALEARSAGQKILLRIGAENARRLKTKLRDIRQRIARGALPGRRAGETVSRP